jgi:hypothetical protein
MNLVVPPHQMSRWARTLQCNMLAKLENNMSWVAPSYANRHITIPACPGTIFCTCIIHSFIHYIIQSLGATHAIRLYTILSVCIRHSQYEVKNLVDRSSFYDPTTLLLSSRQIIDVWCQISGGCIAMCRYRLCASQRVTSGVTDTLKKGQ